MTIWVITWSDGGYDCTNVFIEAYDNAKDAYDRAYELNIKDNSQVSSYSVEEYELNSRSDT